MFLGEFEYKIDEKGRVPVPPKFRAELKPGVVLTAGPEKCIVAYSASQWSKVAASLTSSTMPASKARRLNRAFFASAFSLQIDGQGRIALPVPLREHAGIQDEVIIAGANAYLEIWSKNEWGAEKETAQEQAYQIIESMSDVKPVIK